AGALQTKITPTIPNHSTTDTPDGTVDLRTGQLRAAEQEDLITKLTVCGPAEPGTPPTLWLKFLDRAFASDTETIAFMQRAAGYALTGLTTEHKMLFLYGGGRNGKGVFLNTLNKILGDYSCNAPANLFLKSTYQQHPTELAGLQGARLVIGSEIPRNTIWNEARLKDLTGGDGIPARFMRCDFFTFDPQFTLMIAGNDKPSLSGVDPAIRARLVLVPFTVQIPEEERDPNLVEKLMAEAPAILRWAIEGALLWQDHGLAVPDRIKAASDAYLDEEDLLKNFLQEETVLDQNAITSSGDLYKRFQDWCENQGVQAWSIRGLNREMAARGWSRTRRAKGHFYDGLGLS
ncbi:DNA primase family protein, partial [Alkalilacustris brevis]|uniref:DNA primase family protein n=1 Tax=Alkalilacustris brevis TaxID=2026338 RepID=UPI001EE402BD